MKFFDCAEVVFDSGVSGTEGLGLFLSIVFSRHSGACKQKLPTGMFLLVFVLAFLSWYLGRPLHLYVWRGFALCEAFFHG